MYTIQHIVNIIIYNYHQEAHYVTLHSTLAVELKEPHNYVLHTILEWRTWLHALHLHTGYSNTCYTEG